MTERTRPPRSQWEEARLDLTSLTPGQRYSAVIVLLVAILVALGLPDGTNDQVAGIGDIPDLSGRGDAAASTSQAEITGAQSSEGPVDAPPAAVLPPLAPAAAVSSPPTTAVASTSSPATTTTTQAPPPSTTTTTTSTTQPPAPPLPLPVAPPNPAAR